MSRRIGVLGAERRTERIDLSERQGAQLAFELTRYGQAARLAEEVLRIVDASLVGAGRIVHIERGHVEHRAGTLAVRSGNQRRVQIVESVLVEIFVDRESHCVAYAQYGTESIGARTQIGYVAQELQRVSLLLQRICLGVGRAVYLDAVGLHLDALTRSGRCHQTSVDTDAGTRRDGFELLLADLGKVDDHLYVAYARSVVEGDECHVLVAALGAYPTLDGNLLRSALPAEQSRYSRMFHNFCLYLSGFP